MPMTKERKREYQREYMRKRRAGVKTVATIDPSLNKLNWKPIEGIPGYEVSDCGKVNSVERTMTRSNGRLHTIPARLLSVHPDSKGYAQYYPYVNKKRINVLVHRTVFETFCRKLEPQEEVDHKDNNKLNNRVENLQAVTRLQHARITLKRIKEAAFRKGYAEAVRNLKA
jgi:hypothetical protein